MGMHDGLGHLCDWCASGRPHHVHKFEYDWLMRLSRCRTCDFEVTDRDLLLKERAQ